MAVLSDFDRGVIVGLLVGEGSFGGDGKQPQVTLRMHVRHEAIFKWLMERFPDTRLYGPYHHGGRSYYQWMARGRALVRDVLPLLEAELHRGIDGHAAQRFESMCERYGPYIARERAQLGNRMPVELERDDERLLRSVTERHQLTPAAVAQLRVLLKLLVEDPSAPTSIRAPTKVINDHLADSLVALELEELHDAVEVADIGAGAGLPGLALAIALPEVRFALIESAARKCSFLERARRECGVLNADVVHSRAESWSEGLNRFSVATARALAPLPVVAEYAAPLLKVGGMIVAWRGRRDPAEEEAAARAGIELGLEPRGPRRVHPYREARQRHLHLMLKVRSTSERFPRRPGTALKRPLGR